MHEIRPAYQADLAAIQGLLGERGLSSAVVIDDKSLFWISLQEGELVACIGLELSQCSALLRSVATRHEWQGHGLARGLIERAVREAKARGIDRLYCFSKDVGAFFLKQGWTPVEVERAAEALEETRQVRQYQPQGWYADEKAFSLLLDAT